ncbi:MAG: XdhC family protein [Acidimicrobiales bacterium]
MTSVEEIAATGRRWAAEGRQGVIGRVVALEGFSTWPGGDLVLATAAGEVLGEVLGDAGRAAVAAGAKELAELAEGSGPVLGRAVIELHGRAVAEAGLSCGGRADVLLQPLGSVPEALWEALERRAPVALLTRISGAAAGPASMVVDADRRWWGGLEGWVEASPPPDGTDALVGEAAEALASGHSTTRHLADPGGEIVLTAWVPSPRLVVVGAGELVDALTAQAALLSWEVRGVAAADEVAEQLRWAGASAAVVVLSHDPHVDAPALQAALSAGAPYVGAMGSRRTQSRRLERLEALGVSEADRERIHRPIGLDLGGRSAPEVALAICAEILAARCGRDGRSLRGHEGPIRDRPTRDRPTRPGAPA